MEVYSDPEVNNCVSSAVAAPLYTVSQSTSTAGSLTSAQELASSAAALELQNWKLVLVSGRV